eukprot:1966832-Prymnesium_polylepis.1
MADADDPPFFDIPELMPEKFQGAAGMTSKDVFRQHSAYWMFGEKTEGIAYGAKHRVHHNYRLPNAAELNKSYLSAAHWTPGGDDPKQGTNIAGPPPPPQLPVGVDPDRFHETQEYREWAEQVHRAKLYEEYRRAQEDGYQQQGERMAEADLPFHEQAPERQPHWTVPQQYDPDDYPQHTAPAEFAQQAQQYREMVQAATAGAQA